MVSCAVYLPPFGRLVCGQADGSIAVLSALQAATVLMLQPRKFSRGGYFPVSHLVDYNMPWCLRIGWPQHCVLRGHRGTVTCLLYPSSHSKAYNRDYVLSGAADFTVKLWDLYSGVLVHTFAVHGGKVKDIVSCPPDINVSAAPVAVEG